MAPDTVAATAIDPFSSITTILTCLAVLLTAIAIIIAIAAIWGWVGIKEEARRIATEAADAKLKEYFADEAMAGKIRELMQGAAFNNLGVVAGEGEQDANENANADDQA